MEGIIYLSKKKCVLLKLNDFPECDKKNGSFWKFQYFYIFRRNDSNIYVYSKPHKKNVIPKKRYIEIMYELYVCILCIERKRIFLL